jgi:outer membrane protein assembly factor BamB
MMRRPLPRRAALLGAAGLLAGCDSLDNLFGTRKTPLPGERRSVLRADPTLIPDPGENRTVALPEAQPIADWPQVGGPASHAPGHARLAEAPRQAWRASIGYGSGYRQRITAGPVVAGGRVYAVDAYGEVSAFSLENGGRVWRTDTSREDESAGAMGGGVAVEGGIAYVATGLADVLALNAETGAILWRARIPAPARGAPAVAGGRIFVPTVENHLLALSVEDGRRLWTHRAQPAVTLPLGLPTPAVDGETVVAGFGTGELTALRASDGRVLWGETLGGVANTSLADIVGITGHAVIDRGRVYAMGLGNVTIGVDLRSGRRLWERPFGGGSAVASAGEWVFAVTRGGDAVALGRDDGRIRWVSELDPAPATGSRRGDPATFGPPIVAGGRIMVPSSKAELLLLDPATGAIAGRVPLSAGVTLPGAVSQETLVLLGDDGTLMGLR